MVKPKEQGGFEGARNDKGEVRFSERTLRYYWPNWLVIMDNTHMNICACETCSTTNDIHDSYKVQRRQIVAEAQCRLNNMEDGREKEEYEAKLEAYKNEIFNGQNEHKYRTGRDACEQYGCGVKIAVGDDKLPHFRCIAHQCDECESKDFEAPDFEKEWWNDEQLITYTRFTTCKRCTVHGSKHLYTAAEKPYLRCEICDQLEDDQRSKLKAKVVQKKLRTRHIERFDDFISKGGTLSKAYRKMFSHKYRVILLGK